MHFLKTVSKTYIKHFALLVPIGILLVVQVPNLSLPYFWDEAWSYMTGINKMAEVGPSLLPGALPIDYCKGHPQFFFFLASLWMKLSGGSVAAMRLLPLLFSIGLLVAVYVGLYKIANWQSALFASALISVESMFLAQSIFLLPEMLLALLLVLSFFFFISKKYLLYALSASVMVLTKETAIVFALVFGLFYLFPLVNKNERRAFKGLDLICMLLPGLVYATFLLLHYKAFSILFYGDHVGYIKFDWPVISGKIKSALSSLFVRNGNSMVSLLFVAALIGLLFSKKINRKPVILAVCLIMAFLAFSVLNFYTLRYGLVALIIFIVALSFILGQLAIKPVLKYVVVTLVLGLCFYKSMTQKSNSDVDLGYVNTIKVHQKLVEYCEQKGWQDKTFAVSYNMIFNMRDRKLAYVTGQNDFSAISDWKSYKEAQYFIFESTFENNEIVQEVKAQYTPVVTFTDHHAWGYIYQNPSYIEP